MKTIRRLAGSRKAALLVVLVATSAFVWTPQLGHASVTFDVEFDADLSNCVDNVFVQFKSFEHVNKLLPSGFKARDASAANHAPVPFGFGLVAGVSFECEWSELDGGPVNTSWIFTLVETPVVEGLELEQGIPPTGGEPWLDLYIFGYYTSGRATAAQLRKAGIDVVESVTTVDFEALGRTGSSTISDHRGEVASVEVVGAVPEDKQPNVRFWLQNQEGLSYFQWNRSPYQQFVGEVTACSLRPDTTPATVFGGTDCSALTAPSGVGVVVPTPSTFDGVFRFMEGVQADAAGAEAVR